MEKRSLPFFCVVREILWKYWVVGGDTLGGAAKCAVVGALGILKVGGCCYCSE